MVGHKRVGVQRAVLLAQRFTQPVKIGVIVLFAEKARFAVVSTLHDVQRYAIKVYAGTSQHKPTVAEIIEPGPFNRRALYGQLRRYLGEVFRRLAEQKRSRIEEGHLMPDHVHMMISIPPKYVVSQVVGYIKGKSAIHLSRVYGERKRNVVGQHFWARGYFVSTVGRDEAVIRAYIRNQEQEDRRLDQMEMWR